MISFHAAPSSRALTYSTLLMACQPVNLDRAALYNGATVEGPLLRVSNGFALLRAPTSLVSVSFDLRTTGFTGSLLWADSSDADGWSSGLELVSEGARWFFDCGAARSSSVEDREAGEEAPTLQDETTLSEDECAALGSGSVPVVMTVRAVNYTTTLPTATA